MIIGIILASGVNASLEEVQKAKDLWNTFLSYIFQDAVLVTGLKDISLVSLKDGSLLSSHSIPCEALSPIVHGDFTNDGLMDFVVHCKTR